MKQHWNMTSTISRNTIIYLIIIVSGAVLDQLSKTYLINILPQLGYEIDVAPFVKIVYAWNYGISFGLFADYYQYSNYIFTSINILIVLYLVYLLKYSNEYNHFALSLIIGGAIGNLIDRVIRGAVFDFLYFHYDLYSFPAFNIADSLISFGALIFLIDFYRQKK